MARRKREPMSEGKKNIIAELIEICNRYIRSIFSIPFVGLPRLPFG